MEITVFRKKINPVNGNKPFTKFVTTLTNKSTGEIVYCDVRFDESVEVPKTFPCVITIDKKNANLSHRTKEYTDEKTGETKEYHRNTLWIKAIDSVAEYVDNSLSDF